MKLEVSALAAPPSPRDDGPPGALLTARSMTLRRTSLPALVVAPLTPRSPRAPAGPPPLLRLLPPAEPAALGSPRPTPRGSSVRVMAGLHEERMGLGWAHSHGDATGRLGGAAAPPGPAHAPLPLASVVHREAVLASNWPERGQPPPLLRQLSGMDVPRAPPSLAYALSARPSVDEMLPQIIPGTARQSLLSMAALALAEQPAWGAPLSPSPRVPPPVRRAALEGPESPRSPRGHAGRLEGITVPALNQVSRTRESFSLLQRELERRGSLARSEWTSRARALVPEAEVEHEEEGGPDGAEGVVFGGEECVYGRQAMRWLEVAAPALARRALFYCNLEARPGGQYDPYSLRIVKPEEADRERHWRITAAGVALVERGVACEPLPLKDWMRERRQFRLLSGISFFRVHQSPLLRALGAWRYTAAQLRLERSRGNVETNLLPLQPLMHAALVRIMAVLERLDRHAAPMRAATPPPSDGKPALMPLDELFAYPLLRGADGQVRAVMSGGAPSASPPLRPRPG